MAIQKEKLRRTPPAKPGRMTGEACACFALQENQDLLDIALYVKDGKKVALRYRFFVREDEVRTWDEVDQRWTNADVCSSYGEKWRWNARTSFMPMKKDACELVKKHFGECHKWETPNDKVRSGLSEKVSHKEWEKRQRYIINKENRMEAMIEKHLKQVPPMPKGFSRWVQRSLFRDRQYCFYETAGGRTRTGICSVCGHTMPAPGKRGEKVRCENCGTVLTLRPKNGPQAVNRERVTVIQRLDGDVLLLRELDCEQAQGQAGRFETTVYHRHLHYVQPASSNNSLTLTTNLSICRYAVKHRGAIWGIAQGDCEKKSVVCTLGVDAAIDGTSWARCAVKELGEGNAKRNVYTYLLKWKCVPVIEKLVKAGLKRFANECPHWSFADRPNPTIYEMTKLGKESVGILRAMDGGNDAADILRMLEKKNQKLNREELMEYMGLGVGAFLSDTILEHYGAKEATVYLIAQKELHKDKKMPDIARAWVDIRRLAEALGLSMRNRKMKFPADCIALHDELTDKVNQRQRRENRKAELRKNRRLTGAIRAVAKSMQEMVWEKDGLQIRAIASLPELYDEGTALGHCVGGYGQAIADGRSIIFVVRKTDAPKEPYFTAEVARGQLTQLRGKKNCVPTADVKKFVDTWFRRVYLKKATEEHNVVTKAS